MPEIAVILDIDDYASAAQKPDYVKMSGYYELVGKCEACFKPLPAGVLLCV